MYDYVNSEVYADPADYDRESDPYDPEGSILLDLAAEAAGPVLELGCGTGRVTIPLAQRGLDMTGLERLPHMIDYAGQKSEGLAIRWVCDDVRSFQLGDRYPLIFTSGLVFQHQLARPDQEAMLARAREHLAPGGRFVLDVGFKRPASMVDSPEEQFWYAYVDDSGRQVKVYGTDRYDHLEQIWTQTMVHRLETGGELIDGRTVQLALRYFMPQEMETLLAYNGFTVEARYGDWSGAPLDGLSYTQVYVCSGR